PSLLMDRSSGSCGSVRVTAPFSLIPQAEIILTPIACRACSTRGPGMGAPAQTNVRKVDTVCPDCCTYLDRSVRKGVEAMVKLTPYSRINCTAFSGCQISCN